MRQILVRTDRASGAAVMELLERQGAMNAYLVETVRPPDGVVAVAHVPNGAVEAIVERVQQLEEHHITLLPLPAIVLKPPADEAPDEVTDVGLLSPLEVFLAGMQSVGAWRGFLGYATVAGVVVWIGLFTEVSFLLVAAMLIAPYAGPAMIAAMATSRGDGRLLARSLLRYAASLLVSMAVCLLLSVAMGQEIATTLMVSISELSSIEMLIPLSAGVAGALGLIQSERASLVSGAAIGLLVAVSLAPPAGVVGMAAAIGRWDLVQGAGFKLLLTIVGINVSGAVVFYLAGLRPKGTRYRRGKTGTAIAAFTAFALIAVGLVAWQLIESPDLQHSTRAQRAAAEISRVVGDDTRVVLLESDVRFASAVEAERNTLLADILVRTVAPRTSDLEAELGQTIRKALEDRFGVRPLVSVRFMEP
jgi:uncharacterized hydrophobic protein (TIGR00271 family)